MSAPPPTDPISDVTDVTADQAVDVFLTRPALALLVIVGTWVVTRLARSILRRVVRRVADRSVSNPTRGFWRARVQRVFGETPEMAESRRRQRIDAMSRMATHLFSLVAWITAVIVLLHVMQVDIIPVLTSAGFIGAGLAIGGQHAVKDFIAGVGILVEDRFGVGDRIVIETPTGKTVDGVVEYVGAFSSRLSSDNSTYHFSNGSLAHVRNLSQNPFTTSIEVPIPAAVVGVDDETTTDAVTFALSQAAGNRSLTGMVLVDDVKAAVHSPTGEQPRVSVEVRTAQPLTEVQADRLQRLATHALWQVPALVPDDTDSEGGEPD